VAVQEGILAVALFRAAPADVPAEVGVRSADHQRRGTARYSGGLVEPARFVAFHGGRLQEKSRSRSPEADRLNEVVVGMPLGDLPRESRAILSLIETVNSQPRQRGRGAVTPPR